MLYKVNPHRQYTDLFKALLIEENRNARGNPILTALLYTYCPAAAGYWLAGADPVPAFDPVWAAMWDYGSDERLSLAEALVAKELENSLDVANRYKEGVEGFRKKFPAYRSPELSDLFDKVRFEKNERFGNNAGINKYMDERWDNFFIYVRTWLFLVDDWALSARMPVNEESVEVEMDRVELSVALPGIKAVYFPAWMWTQTLENGEHQVIGLLTSAFRHDQLRFLLAQKAGGWRPVPRDERGKPSLKPASRAWKALPEVWALDYPSGVAEMFDSRLRGGEGLAGIVMSFHRMADKGPWPPMRAFSDPGGCSSCGFFAQCFTPHNQFAPLALNGLIPGQNP